MKVGFYAGSFDPFTIGHLHIVKVASKIFDKVVIGIGINSQKIRRFDKMKMKDAIAKLLKAENLENCEVITFDNLMADVASEYNADFLIRGIRNGIDYDFEENLALMNEEISGIDILQTAEKQIEDRLVVLHAMFVIAVHHGQLIEVGHHGQISHLCASLFCSTFIS